MYVIHLGYSGFPVGNAAIQRIRLTFKALKGGVFTPLILNRHSLNLKETKKLARYDGIPYINLSLNNNRPTSFIKRNFNKVTGIILEVLFLVKRRKHIHAAIYYDSSYFRLFYYRILAKILRFKMVIQYVELRSSISSRQSIKYKLNDYLFDNFCFILCDGIIVISEFLLNYTKLRSPLLPLIKIPAICDFSESENIGSLEQGLGNYLMYCGTIEYLPVIEFLLHLFKKLKVTGQYNGSLLLVVSGNNLVNLNKLKNILSIDVTFQSVIIRRDIPYKLLLQYYKGATLLLIPLRNTVQDVARFPHKVGEYTASGSPIMSTNIGELLYYFEDGKSALLAEEYSIDSYYEKIFQGLNSTDKLKSIGEQGHRIGYENFDFNSFRPTLSSFLSNL